MPSSQGSCAHSETQAPYRAFREAERGRDHKKDAYLEAHGAFKLLLQTVSRREVELGQPYFRELYLA